MKLCTTCNTKKEPTEFHVRRASPDGLCYICKPCVKKAATTIHKKNRSDLASGVTKYQVPEVKFCTACGFEKRIDDFGKDTLRVDGHTGWCRECLSAAAKKRNKKRIESVNADVLWTQKLKVKVCTSCKVEMDVSSFNKDSMKKDRLASRCRVCDAKARGAVGPKDINPTATGLQRIIDEDDAFIQSVFYPED